MMAKRPRCTAQQSRAAATVAVGAITMSITAAPAAVCREVATHRVMTPGRIAFRCGAHAQDVPTGATVIAITEMESAR